MNREKRNARRTYHSNDGRSVRTETNSTKYTTAATIAAGALFAFPIVDDLTNMPSLSYFVLMAFAIIIATLAISLSESLRCSR